MLHCLGSWRFGGCRCFELYADLKILRVCLLRDFGLQRSLFWCYFLVFYRVHILLMSAFPIDTLHVYLIM